MTSSEYHDSHVVLAGEGREWKDGELPSRGRRTKVPRVLLYDTAVHEIAVSLP